MKNIGIYKHSRRNSCNYIVEVIAMNLRELHRQFELKKMELSLAEKTKKPGSVRRIYKELKQLQYLLVTSNISKAVNDLDPV
jgi:hypothetical protein